VDREGGGRGGEGGGQRVVEEDRKRGVEEDCVEKDKGCVLKRTVREGCVLMDGWIDG
jgi:hypothetical protein